LPNKVDVPVVTSLKNAGDIDSFFVMDNQNTRGKIYLIRIISFAFSGK